MGRIATNWYRAVKAESDYTSLRTDLGNEREHHESAAKLKRRARGSIYIKQLSEERSAEIQSNW